MPIVALPSSLKFGFNSPKMAKAAGNAYGSWTAQHQMSMNGKRDHFTPEDFAAFARVAGMKRGRDKAILQEVQEAMAILMIYCVISPELANKIVFFSPLLT